MLNRRESRQQAFELIFESSFGCMSFDDIVANAVDARDLVLSEYAEKLVTGVFEHIDEIDGYIAQYSNSRNIRRLSRVVLAVLRLAFYEILYENELDVNISINEAVEIAKTFSSKKEAGFVNGVLGGFIKEHPDIKTEKVARAEPSGETK